MKLRVLFAGLILGWAALAAESGAELFQKAVTQERAAGNLEEAIKLYQRVAREFASDRELAAKALVQAAQCYEKLGQEKQDQAVRLYQQVAREFKDQSQPAATASARLAALRQSAPVPTTMTQRKIEIASARDQVYTDGQRAIYRDAATGAIMIGDLSGKNQRVVFKPNPGNSFVRFKPSRDFSAVALFVSREAQASPPLAVIKADGTGYREIGGRFAGPLVWSWSWDSRYILECPPQPDGTSRLIAISVADGQIREVPRPENTRIGAAVFSPDGRFIAYSDSEGSIYAGKVFVLPTPGGEPQLISENATLLDWTRDGRYVAVASPHSDVMALHLLPVKDGHPAGEPVFVRYGSILEGHTTSSGALLFTSAPEGGAIRTWVADLDPDGRPSAWKSLKLGSNTRALPVPAWSPDSSQIAYTASNEDSGQAGYVVRIRNLATGKERDLYRGAGITFCTWAVRHDNLFCSERTNGGAMDILSVALDSGRAERLGSVQGYGLVLDVPGPDDQAVYVWGQLGHARWDIGTRQETRLEPPAQIPNVHFEPSRDGGWLKRVENGNLEVRPMSGGDWKPLLPMSANNQSGFSPDGKWIFYHDADAPGKEGLYRVATAGGRPERLGDFPTSNLVGLLRVSPDGHKIIAVTPDFTSRDTWLLENFVPKASAAH